ncbi:DUF927 domain-containing protein [Candidatus Poribacteria bacterium]|nr:DUF927 domain-containing protein [Candidatus Poribacteria bacterium]
MSSHRSLADTAPTEPSAGPHTSAEGARVVTPVYRFLLDRLTLSDAHRRELREKRGFTDDTIDALEFRSVDGFSHGVEMELRERFPVDDLVASGVLDRRSVAGGAETAETRLSGSLAGHGIVIPYFDDAGECITVRRHKHGLSKLRRPGEDEEDEEAMERAGRNPVELYVPRLDVRDRDTLYVAEGEFKAVANAQMGFWTIAVPGVSSFAGKHFARLVDWLKDHGVERVRMVFDTEDKATPGLSGYKEDVFRRYDTQFYAWRMAWQLDRAGLHAEIATLPLEWDPERRKVDVDGAVGGGKRRSEFADVYDAALSPREYLRHAPGVTDEARVILALKIGAKLLEREDDTKPGYAVSVGNGVMRVTREKQKRGAGKEATEQWEDKWTQVAAAPVWLAGLGEVVEAASGQYVEVAYTYPRDGKPVLRKLLVERDAIANRAKLIDLSASGFPVNSGTAGHCVSYLSELEARIAPMLPTRRYTERNGWHAVDGVDQYVIGRKTLTAKRSQPGNRAQLRTGEHGDLHVLADAMRPAGNVDRWRELALEARDASNHGRLMLSASFAAPLVHLLNVRSPILHLYGQTRSGKTALLRLAASVWANPQLYLVTHNATPTSLEGRAQFLCDMLFCLDELQLQRNPQLRETLIYMFAQGTGRTRAKAGGGLRDTARWRGLCISTGEEQITSDTDPGGQASRALELRVPMGMPLVDEDLADRLYRLTDWGHAGMAFLNELIRADRDDLRKRHGDLDRELRDKLPDMSGASRAALAAVALADTLSCEWALNKTGREDEAVDLMHALFSDQPAPESVAERALQRTVAWIDANPRHFIRVRDSAISEGETELQEQFDPCYGVITREGEVWMFPDGWGDMMRQHNLNPRRITGDFRERGWVETDYGADMKPRHPLRQPPERKRQRMVVLNERAFEAVAKER